MAQQSMGQTATLRREANGALSYLVQTNYSRERCFPDDNVTNRTQLSDIRRAALMTTSVRNSRTDLVIVHDEKLAGLHAKSSQLLLFDWAVEHCGLCAAFRDGHPHHFRRIGDGPHASYVPEFFVIVAIFLAAVTIQPSILLSSVGPELPNL
ncbi:hypothetical protein HAP41_0000006880 [Bradyrhizobium barranii subsp. apii]|uniref:Uncharacterized protein n=2 Tax=Bradyrhizobium TaxID=374 RepID=A0A8T5VFZ5_9BRAD|nr:hypothetical protein [Bradyrhizobium barranii]UPT88767.1 hypothetical protein HAP41_0000006880 [Bradyrhizobium barranii subsp. apii]